MKKRVPAVAALIALLALATCGKDAPSTPTPTSTPATCNPTPGTTCYGKQQYVEFTAGAFPIVISVPHGGSVAPAAIPDRTGTTVTDLNTIDLGRAVADAFLARTGRRPHLVICHLRRTKLDANRDVGEAAQGNADAIQAWTEYHAFIELAMTTATASGGRGFYLDLHGHGHTIQRLELGYLLSASTLNLSDAELDMGGHASQSSLRLAVPMTVQAFSQLLRGPSSLGGLLGPATPSVPSPAVPSPGSDPYFEGGYSTERHTARLPGLQIESNFTGVRDTAGNRAAFADRLVAALVTFVDAHLGIR
jgi:hypothetical protein